MDDLLQNIRLVIDLYPEKWILKKRNQNTSTNLRVQESKNRQSHYSPEVLRNLLPKRRCINFILNSTTGAVLGLSLSAQYKSLTMSYMWQNLLLCLFFSVCHLQELISRYTSSHTCLVLLLLLSAFPIPYSFYISLYLYKKAKLSLDFFDSLTAFRNGMPLFCFIFLY